MTNFDFTPLFGNENNPFSRYFGKEGFGIAAKTKKCRSRICRIEELESREMLSVTPWFLNDEVVLPLGDIDADTQPPSAVCNLPAPLAAAPAGYNEHDWQKVESQGLGTYATWKKVGSEMRLVELKAAEKGIKTLDLSGCDALEYLLIANNNKTLDKDKTSSLNINGCTALKELRAGYNLLTTLDLSGYSTLEYIHVGGNAMTSLNLTGCSALTELRAGNNLLTTLDISDCVNLVKLRLNGNQLSALDISKNTKLNEVSCESNQLTTLDVSYCTVLKYLSCDENQLTELDVSKNTALTQLWCNDNQLTELDVSFCIALERLGCYDNALTSLNISTCAALTHLNCSGNQLTSLDVSICTKLQRLNCQSNPLSFATLKLPSGLDIWLGQWKSGKQEGITYQTITIPATPGAGGVVDLSLYVIAGTKYTWYNADSKTVIPSAAYSMGANGVFTFTGVNNVRIYCEMSHDSFPKMIVKTTAVSIAKLAVPTLSTPNVTDSDTISISWSVARNASGYVVEYKKATDVGWSSENVTITETTATITGLSENTNYNIRVMAIGTGEYSDSDWSAAKSATTKALPQDILTVTGGANSLVIDWKTPQPSNTILQYRQVGSSQWTTWIGSDLNTIPGLKADAYAVQLVNKQGDIIDSETGIVVTSGTPVAVPQKHKASMDKKESKPTISSVTLKITPHKNATDQSNVRYIVDIVKSGKNIGRPAGFIPISVTAEWLAKKGGKILIEGLNHNVSYKFTVTAVNANGETLNGKTKPKDVVVNVTAKTTKYTAVQKLQSPKVNITASSVNLTWLVSKTQVPIGAATRYEVLWYPGTSKTPAELPATMMVLIPTGSTTALITGLSPNTKYKFAVRAITTVDSMDISSLDAKISVKTAKPV